jgi:hypothetical protein
MKFEGKFHKIVVEMTILTRLEPDDAGFDMHKSSPGEVAMMRTRREELTEEEAVRQAIEMGLDHRKLLEDAG